MIDNFLDCLATKYFKFSERANRREYWSFVAVEILLFAILEFAGKRIDVNTVKVLFTVYLLVPGLAVCVRRLHDVSKGIKTLVAYYTCILLTVGTVMIRGFYGTFIRHMGKPYPQK